MPGLTKALKSLRLGDIAVRRSPLFYPEARAALRCVEAGDAAVRRDWTGGRLAEVLRLAARTPYGRRIGGGESLAGWPLLEKAAVLRDPAAFRVPRTPLVAKASTGGTSGEPLRLVRSLRSIAFEQACIDRMLELLGLEPSRARIAILRGDSIKDPADLAPPYWRFDAGGQRLLLSSFHLNGATVAAYAEALERFAPDVLWAHPNTIDSLCVHLQRAGRRLSLPRALTSSEVLRPAQWRFITATLGCRLLDYYGQAERVGFAYALAPGEYRFLPGYAHIELRRAGGTGEDAGQALYEIVGTSLWNLAMPLVRYRTGDLARLPASLGEQALEEVALGVRPFEGILGRDGDFLLSPEGTRLISPGHFVREVPHLARVQVIQESAAQVRILVLDTEAFSGADEARLLRNVRAKVPPSMQVSVERVATLERTARGKTPFVIHRPAVKALLRAAGA